MQIGGDYGKNWLVNNGDKSVAREPSGGLWSWGTVPKGQYLTNGTLEPIGASTIYYPSFVENSTPIIMNNTANLGQLLPARLRLSLFHGRSLVPGSTYRPACDYPPVASMSCRDLLTLN